MSLLYFFIYVIFFFVVFNTFAGKTFYVDEINRSEDESHIIPKLLL